MLLAVAVIAAVVAFGRTPGARPPAAAEPEETTYTLTLTQPTSGGVLDHVPKRDAHAAYERVVIRAREHAGYQLTGWGGDCAHIPASTGRCMLTMDADKTVSATFGLVGATPTPTPTPTSTPTPTPPLDVPTAGYARAIGVDPGLISRRVYQMPDGRTLQERAEHHENPHRLRADRLLNAAIESMFGELPPVLPKTARDGRECI